MDVTSYLLGKKAGGGSAPVLQDKEVEITENGETTITADSGYDGLSSVDVTTNVSGGGGTTINGTIVQKTIGSGTVNKGDFVETGSQAITSYPDVDSGIDIDGRITQGSKDSIIDGDENTYARVTNGTKMARVYVECKSREALNIPTNAKIKSILLQYKMQYLATGTSNRSVLGYKSGDGIRNKTWLGASLTNTNYVETTSMIENTINLMDYFSADLDIDGHGFQIMISESKTIDVYYIRYIIEYEVDNTVKKITANGVITGIANGDGTVGDTIEVYIPNTSNQ